MALNRRDFIKGAAMGVLAVNTTDILPNEKAFAADKLSVKTRYGKINGFIDENGVKTWLGIPYAKPPVKNLRWQAPQPLKPSDKTFAAKKFGAAAMQPVDPTEDADSYSVQSEDCLTLNIWTRGEGKNKPVMVFIHGGGFCVGGSMDSLYNGSNFAAAHDVVIVTLNYRLNVFGFINFAEIDKNFEDSGYLGIKDQIAALQWVKENIAEFGGNPDNITIFGQSAGSISCMLLTVTPAAKNLFNKAIPQSGHLSFYHTPENSAKIAENFLKNSGVKTVGELVKKSAEEIKDIYSKFGGGLAENPSEYFPTCDGKFLPLDPLQALKDGAARGIKFLTGNVADEWRLWLQFDENFSKKLRNNPKIFSPALSRYKAKTYEEIYKSWLKNRSDNEENFINFATQADWRVGQELAVEYQSKFEDVYFYVFTHQLNETLRACHDSDLPYTFNVSVEDLPNAAPNLAKAVQATWAAFATTGNPDNELIPHWEKYSANNRQTMELNSKCCTCHKDLNNENLDALRYVYEN